MPRISIATSKGPHDAIYQRSQPLGFVFVGTVIRPNSSLDTPKAISTWRQLFPQMHIAMCRFASCHASSRIRDANLCGTLGAAMRAGLFRTCALRLNERMVALSRMRWTLRYPQGALRMAMY